MSTACYPKTYFFLQRFCVVSFSDDSVDVVPTKWVNKEQGICYWPKSKSVTQLVKAEASPCLTTWSIEKVTIIKYCRKLYFNSKLLEHILLVY